MQLPYGHRQRDSSGIPSALSRVDVAGNWRAGYRHCHSGPRRPPRILLARPTPAFQPVRVVRGHICASASFGPPRRPRCRQTRFVPVARGYLDQMPASRHESRDSDHSPAPSGWQTLMTWCWPHPTRWRRGTRPGRPWWRSRLRNARDRVERWKLGVEDRLPRIARTGAPDIRYGFLNRPVTRRGVVGALPPGGRASSVRASDRSPFCGMGGHADTLYDAAVFGPCVEAGGGHESGESCEHSSSTGITICWTS
jgi:hypothetical protein